MPQIRRVPIQKRSRDKYDLILSTAKELIGERGNDSVSMREIAKQAGLAISSIYQYFPDKNAILEAIMRSYFDSIRELITSFLYDVETFDDLQGGINFGVDLFYCLFKQDPALAALWTGMQANNELKEMDTEDSRFNAKLIAGKMVTLDPVLNHNEVYNAILLLIHTAGMTVRMALSLPKDEGDALLEELKSLATLRINNFKQ